MVKNHSLKLYLNAKSLKKLRAQLSEQQIVLNSVKSGWKTRQRKLNLFQFLQLFICPRSNTSSSLTNMRQELLEDSALLSKQGINKRINSKAVKMLQLILEDVLKVNFLPITECLNAPFFTSVKITDATCFQLPEVLNKFFKGFGGNHGAMGGAKVQYQMSLTHGEVCMTTGSATESDQKSTIIQPLKGELHLFDLGYFSFARLKEFEEKEAFYLCRLKVNTLLWVKKNDEFELLTWKEIAKKHKGHQVLELEVYLGQNKEVKTRLFVEKIDKKLAEKKRRNAKRYSQRHGKTASAKKLTTCDFSVHISNVPQAELSKENARKAYSLRWQIELQFKTWKSFMNIDKVLPSNPHRFLCHHYGTLIYIMLCGKLFFACKQLFWREKEVELSELKAMKYFSRNKQLVYSLIFKPKHFLDELIRKLETVLQNTCVKEFKKQHQTPMNIMMYALS